MHVVRTDGTSGVSRAVDVVVVPVYTAMLSQSSELLHPRLPAPCFYLYDVSVHSFDYCIKNRVPTPQFLVFDGSIATLLAVTDTTSGRQQRFGVVRMTL